VPHYIFIRSAAATIVFFKVAVLAKQGKLTILAPIAIAAMLACDLVAVIDEFKRLCAY